jgi:hypothetical protein
LNISQTLTVSVLGCTGQLVEVEVVALAGAGD